MADTQGNIFVLLPPQPQKAQYSGCRIFYYSILEGDISERVCFMIVHAMSLVYFSRSGPYFKDPLSLSTLHEPFVSGTL